MIKLLGGSDFHDILYSADVSVSQMTYSVWYTRKRNLGYSQFIWKIQQQQNIQLKLHGCKSFNVKQKNRKCWTKVSPEYFQTNRLVVILSSEYQYLGVVLFFWFCILKSAFSKSKSFSSWQPYKELNNYKGQAGPDLMDGISLPMARGLKLFDL